MSSTQDAKPALKMKIKRKNVSATRTTSAEVKHEIIKDSQLDTPVAMATPDTALNRLKQALEKDRSTKVTKNSPSLRHKERKKEATTSSSTDGLTLLHIKREPTCDPYEFNSKVEDGPGPVTKKIKAEKDAAPTVGADSSPMHTLSTAWGRRDVGVETSSIGVVTDPDCLGPCEPGSHVVLEGIVWNETPTGLLVVNVTWRGKTYVGTLMDATRHDWAPPRFTDESTPAEPDTKTPKGRGKRGRGAATAPVGESCTVGERRLRKTRGRMGSNNQAAHPASPGKPDLKRKARDEEIVQEAPKRKRGKILDAPGPDGLIVCPENLCCKRYRHVNGLRYHLTHFHKRNLIYDEEGNMITEAAEEFVKPAPVTDEAKFRKRTGLDATRADSPRKTAVESLDKVPPPSPKKIDEEKKRKEQGKKIDKKPPVSVAPIIVVPSGTTNSPNVSTAGESEMKKGKGKKAKAAPPTILASVTTHPQVSVSNGDQLQPIQPKPTVLGTTSATSDLVDSLKQMKETKRAKKKKKEKKKEHHKTVIKATTVSIPTLNDGAKQPPELHRQNMQPPQLDKQRLTPPDLQKANGRGMEPASNTRTNRPPSSLSLNSPVVAPEKESDHESDDLHSPAYSDISDANDSVPLLENQSEEHKSTEKELPKPKEMVERPQEKPAELAKGTPPYGLFPGAYYGQPPYLTPAVVPDAPKASTPGEEKRKTPVDKQPNTPKEADKARGHYPPSYYMGGAFPDKYREQFMPPEYKAQKEAWLQRQKDAEPVDMSSKPIKKEQATDLSLKDKHSETKQILKENLEVKAQMPSSSAAALEDPKSLLERQQDELQSFYVYQQQRVIDQQSRFLGKPKTHSPGLPQPSKPSPKNSPKLSVTPTSSKPRTPWHPEDEAKERVKSQERARPTSSPKGAEDKRPGNPSASSVPHPFAHYYPHYANAGQLPFDSTAHPSAMFPANMVPFGPNSPYMHPSQLHYLPDEEKERAAAKAEGGKALDLLQQRASHLYGMSRNHSPNTPSTPHKIHELKDAAKDRADSCSPVSSKSPAPEKERGREGVASSSKDDKARSSSPPTQRHLHTHHHTHVVGPAYPIYGHYPCKSKPLD